MPRPTLHFTQAEYDARLARTRAAMQAREIELLIVTDPANMAWLTGYDGWSFYVHQCVIVPPQGTPLWFGRAMDVPGAYRTCYLSESEIIGYPDIYIQSTERHPMDYLCGQLADRGWGALRIGVEMDNYWFTAAAYAALRNHLPNARFDDATALVNWQRAIKSAQELAYMRIAGVRVTAMHARIRDIIEPGLRKCDLAAEIQAAALRFDPATGSGGDYPAIVPLLPSGPDAAAAHLTWDDRPLVDGEGTFFEIAGVHHRYHCPLSRTVFLGTPPRKFREAEAAVAEGLDAGLAAARPGNTCEDIALAFFRVLKAHGFEKDSRAGYPIGLAYPPDWGEHTMSLRAGDRTLLAPGMTLHFMTGLWLEDWGFEMTESIAITDAAPECLALVPRELIVKN